MRSYTTLSYGAQLKVNMAREMAELEKQMQTRQSLVPTRTVQVNTSGKPQYAPDANFVGGEPLAEVFKDNGDRIVFAVTDFKGKYYFQVREWYTDSDNIIRATKKGTTFEITDAVSVAMAAAFRIAANWLDAAEAQG